eukprot:CAMPEP_0172501114 /NCGR_PEP_ID=MMETSP1066-20121228/146260_1 /TAXON_ID=671091 /ORGANISM="Coscinodiscus wailesii, Strain CCMP2513" /LENGTH=301 /DNA_ID=CAMNT_0013275727 /DNA_START=54 /DNA_END=959 /DNA_ORIENTATION=+
MYPSCLVMFCFAFLHKIGIFVIDAAAATEFEIDDITDNERDVDVENDDVPPWWETDIDMEDIISDELKCDEIVPFSEIERPIVTKKTWSLLRETYKTIVGKGYSTIPPLDDDDDDTERGGFHVPYEVKMTAERGRGVFVKDIPVSRGRVVADDRYLACIWVGGDDNRTVADVGRLYRLFLASIPREMACEMVGWTWTYEEGLCFGLDDQNFINHGDEANIANIGNENDKDNVYVSSITIASRDIAVGEEILDDYSAFVGEGGGEVGWEHFGLGDDDDDEGFLDQFWNSEERREHEYDENEL